MFEFACPHCSQSIFLDASDVEALIQCAHCATMVEAPAALLTDGYSTVVLTEQTPKKRTSNDEPPMTQAQMADTTHGAEDFAPAKDPRVNLVLGQWEKAWRDGNELCPEELCKDCPEILPQVIDGIQLLRQVLEAIKQLQSLADNVNFTAYVVPTLSEFPGSEPAELPKIPGYEIIRVLGRGGMGIVYQARQVDLHNIVALKMILTRSTAREKQRARFLREAKTVANLHHPHIVQLYQFGHHKNQPFFTLEFMSGGDLADRLEREPLTVAEAVVLIERLAQAIAYAHQQGVVHRDLKPKNILLTDQNIPKVADFGLVKPTEQTDASTDTNIVIGTPPYMPPEQAKALHREVGPRADIYSLGAILYHCLTGRPPFLGPTPVDTLKLVIEDELVPPRRLQPGVPKDVETICMKCLRKDPKQRYASAQHLAEDLQCVQANNPLKYARPVGRIERIVKWAKRRPTAASLVLVVTIMVLLAIGGFSAAFRIVLQERENFKKAKERADQSRQELFDQQAKAKTMRNKESWFTYGATLREAQLHLQSQNWPAALKTMAKCQWDFRSWIYDRFMVELNGGHQVWRGHRHEVSCMDFSRDGRWLASCSAKSVFIWDVRTGTIGQQWPAHECEYKTIAIHPSQDVIAVGRSDGVIDLRKITNGILVRKMADPGGHSNSILDLEFSADGKWLASAGSDQLVGLWDAKTGKLLRTLRGHNAPVNRVAFSPDKYVLLTGSFDNTVKIWKINSWIDEKSKRLVIHAQASMDPQLRFAATVNAVAFHPANWSMGWFGYDYEFVTATGDAVIVWRILYKLGDTKLAVQRRQVLYRHTKRVTHVCLSPKGNRLVSASEDGSVVVWDMRTGRVARKLHGHWGSVACVAVHRSKNGVIIASAGKDKTIRTWRVDGQRDDKRVIYVGYQLNGIAISDDGRYVAGGGDKAGLTLFDVSANQETAYELENPQPHSSPAVLAIAFSRKHDRLAATYADGTVIVWNVTSKKVTAFIKNSAAIRAVVFLPCGERIAFAGDQQQIEIWRISKKPLLEHRIATKNAAIHALAISDNGEWMASGAVDKDVKLWRLRKGKYESQFLRKHAKEVTRVAFSPDGEWLASGGKDKMIKLWDLREKPGHEPFNLVGHSDQVTGLTFHPENNLLLSMDNNNELLIWHVPTRLLLVRLTVAQFEGRRKNGICGMAIDGLGNSLVMATGSNAIHLWKNGIRESVRSLAWTSAPVHWLASGNSGKWTAAALGDNSIRLWNMKSGKDILTLLGHEGPVSCVAVHPHDPIVASASHDGEVFVWDSDGKRKRRWLHGRAVTGVALSSDGGTLASVGKDGYVRFGPTNSLVDGNVLSDPIKRKTQKSYTCLAFSRDDTWLATGDTDGEIAFWDVRARKFLRRLHGHTMNKKSVTSLAFSRDRKYLASSSADGTAKIWSLASGKNVLTLATNESAPLRVSRVVYSPDGRWIITVGDDEAIKIWRAEDGKLMRKLHGHAEKITNAVFSANDEWLITGDASGHIQCWRWSKVIPRS